MVFATPRTIVEMEKGKAFTIDELFAPMPILGHPDDMDANQLIRKLTTEELFSRFTLNDTRDIAMISIIIESQGGRYMGLYETLDVEKKSSGIYHMYMCSCMSHITMIQRGDEYNSMQRLKRHKEEFEIEHQ